MTKPSPFSLKIEPKEISFDRPASSQIFGFVRDSIVSMELQPGQLISETALAQQFGVSRTPVREALIQLSNRGFVEVLPQRGTYVTRLSMNKIYEAQFIREALEVAVVSHLASAAQELRNNVVSKCEKILENQKTAADDDDSLAFQNLDDEFHQSLATLTNHFRTAELIEAEKAHMDRVRNLSLHISGQYKRVLNQHIAIIKAIKSGSADKAATAMSVHLQDVFAILELIPKQHPEYFE